MMPPPFADVGSDFWVAHLLDPCNVCAEMKRAAEKTRAKMVALKNTLVVQRDAEFEAEMRALAIQVMTGNMTHIEVGANSFVVPNKTALSVRPR